VVASAAAHKRHSGQDHFITDGVYRASVPSVRDAAQEACRKIRELKGKVRATEQDAQRPRSRLLARCSQVDAQLATPLMDAFSFKQECVAQVEKFNVAFSILLASCQDVLVTEDMNQVSRCRLMNCAWMPVPMPCCMRKVMMIVHCFYNLACCVSADKTVALWA
jgi:hypothetical protein